MTYVRHPASWLQRNQEAIRISWVGLQHKLDTSVSKIADKPGDRVSCRDPLGGVTESNALNISGKEHLSPLRGGLTHIPSP